MPADPETNRICLSVCLCKNNFDSFNWQVIRHLKSKDCDKEIKVDKLTRCEDKITSIDFAGLTSYTNLKTLLHRCPNLRNLSLSNILLNHYETDYKKFYLIETPELRNIKFSGQGKLTKDEMHILDFFFRRVRFVSLQSLIFEHSGGKRSDDKQNQQKAPRRNNFTKASVTSSSLTNFLVQNQATLKCLRVKRLGIPLCNIKFDSSTSEIEESQVKFQLNDFECDIGTIGFEKILNSQSTLERLICLNKKTTSPRPLTAIYSAIRRCAETLKEIKIVQIITPDLETENSDFIHHDCTSYKFCQKLERLQVELTIPEQFTCKDFKNDRPGVVLNLRLLPLQISHLILRFEHVSQHAIELFMSRIGSMKNLKFMVFHGKAESPFKVKSTWISQLVDHPPMEICEFSNFNGTDLEDLTLLQKSRPELSNSLKINSSCCIFWKDCPPGLTNKEKPSSAITNINNNNI